MTDKAAAGNPAVLVIRNAPDSGPRRLTGWLTGAGLDVTVVDGEQLLTTGLPPAAALNGFAGVVLLGGGFMPDADGRAPWLPAERALAAQALDDRVPLLGICLGSQLLALVAGGEVTADSGEIERGSCGVDLLPAAAEDQLLGPLAHYGSLRMIQNHRDSTTALPPDATLLANSDACRVEAFRVGECAWGLQFHPEADAARLAAWDSESLVADGYDPAEVIARGRADAAVNEEQAHTLISAFADVVRRSRTDS